VSRWCPLISTCGALELFIAIAINTPLSKPVSPTAIGKSPVLDNFLHA